jgi:hypothetical protein
MCLVNCSLTQSLGGQPPLKVVAVLRVIEHHPLAKEELLV